MNSGYVPIAKPRGLPFDVSPEVVAISEWWGDEGFSHSYLTVAELLGYDWTQVITICRFVSALAYWEWGLRGRQHGEGPERKAATGQSRQVRTSSRGGAYARG